MKFSDFNKAKNHMVEPTAERFYSWKENEIPRHRDMIGLVLCKLVLTRIMKRSKNVLFLEN